MNRPLCAGGRNTIEPVSVVCDLGVFLGEEMVKLHCTSSRWPCSATFITSDVSRKSDPFSRLRSLPVLCLLSFSADWITAIWCLLI